MNLNIILLSGITKNKVMQSMEIRGHSTVGIEIGKCRTHVPVNMQGLAILLRI